MLLECWIGLGSVAQRRNLASRLLWPPTGCKAGDGPEEAVDVVRRLSLGGVAWTSSLCSRLLRPAHENGGAGESTVGGCDGEVADRAMRLRGGTKEWQSKLGMRLGIFLLQKVGRYCACSLCGAKEK